MYMDIVHTCMDSTKEWREKSMHAFAVRSSAGDDGTARSTLSIVSLSSTLGSHVREYGCSACDTYEISRRQPRDLTTPETGGKVSAGS